MRCRKIISYLNAYADGELSEKKCCLVEAHLAKCDSCRRRLAEIRALDEQFRQALPVPPVPDGLTSRIMAGVRARQRTKDTRSTMPFPNWNPLQLIFGLSTPMKLATCAAVFIALVLATFFGGGIMTGRRSVAMQPNTNLYGLEWFEPAPPGTISSAYIAMAEQVHE